MKSSNDKYDAMWGEAFSLNSGQLLVWEHGLTALKEHCEHLTFRAQHYDDVPRDFRAEYIEKMQDITARISQIIKSAQEPE